MRLVLALSVAFVTACATVATPAQPTATPEPATTAPGTASPAASFEAQAPPPPELWTVLARSKATVRVREQLAGVSFANDAVLVATGAAGSFVLNDDGSFSPESKITFELTTLTSDSRDRDNIVKSDTLDVRRFPRAELVPTKAADLALPLLATGDLAFTLHGRMTIRGTTKDVTFDVTAKRDGRDLVVTASANPTWRFGDFGMRRPSSLRVLSVVDEIRLVVELVAETCGPTRC